MLTRNPIWASSFHILQTHYGSLIFLFFKLLIKNIILIVEWFHDLCQVSCKVWSAQVSVILVLQKSVAPRLGQQSLRCACAWQISNNSHWTLAQHCHALYYVYTTNVIVVAVVSVALAQSYKNYYYNVFDASLLNLLTMLYVTLLPMVFYHSPKTENGLKPINGAILLFLLTYTIVCICDWLKIWRLVSYCWYTLYWKMRGGRQSLCIEEY